MNHMILAGDIGGTKCNLAVFEERRGTLRVVFRNRYASHEFSSLEKLVKEFISQSDPHHRATASSRISAAGFGVAGAVFDGRLHANNLTWELDPPALAQALDLQVEDIVFMNDLAATAAGLEKLMPQDFFALNQGVAQPQANKALIAPGTGLGEAILFWDGHQYLPSHSEGGAADFAPRTAREIQFLLFLKQHLPRVSCEEIFSGRGFRRIHEFLNPSVRHISFEEAAGESAKEITQEALAGTCPVCAETLDFWIGAFGAEAGNLALRVLAYGGVYLAGGIVLKILPKLKESIFCRSFADKASMNSLLARVPIFVVLNEDAPVLGAAYEALEAIRIRSRFGA